MLDSVFNTPCYDDKFRRVFEFAQYANMADFWLELEYYVTRDAFQSRLGAALDVDILSFGGNAIFRDISAAEKALLTARGYLVIQEEITPQTDFEDIYKVKELYGYAPASNFTKYTSEIITRPGVDDPAGYLQLAITPTAGLCTYDVGQRTFVFNLGAEIAGQLSAGESIHFYGAKIKSAEYDLQFAAVEITEVSVSAGTIKTPAFGATFETSGSSLSEQEIAWFFNKTLYIDGVLLKRTTTLTRDLTKRGQQAMSAAVRNNITYHTTFPVLEEKFFVTNSLGIELDTITTQTIPTIAQWKAKVAGKEEIICAEAEVDDTYAPYIYKKTVKYARCR